MILAVAPVEMPVDLNSVSHLGWIDFIVLALLLVGATYGLKKGLAAALKAIIGVMAAQVLAIQFSESTANLVHMNIPIPTAGLHIIVFFLIAVGSIALVYFLFVFLSLVGSIQFKSALNWLGGLIFGGILAILFASLVLTFLILFPSSLIQDAVKNGSITGARLVDLTTQVHDLSVRWIPEALEENPKP